jgi:RNA recognition motif. (a.k.a. RRM, RBD, or RNP domain)
MNFLFVNQVMIPCFYVLCFMSSPISERTQWRWLLHGKNLSLSTRLIIVAECTRSKTLWSIQEIQTKHDSTRPDVYTFGRLRRTSVNVTVRRNIRRMNVGNHNFSPLFPSLLKSIMSASVASTAASTVSSRPASSSITGRSPQPKKILVHSVSNFTTENDLRSLFQGHGRIAFVHMPVNKKGKRLNIALVQYACPDGAARAMVALQGVALDFMILRLEWAKPKGNNNNAGNK